MSQRIAFSLGPITIYWYGVFVALGFIAALLVMQWRAGKASFARERIADLVVAAMIGGIVGARLFYVAINWSYFARNPLEIVMVQHGGLVFYGGFIGATLAVLLLCRKRQHDPWVVADLMAIGVPLGQTLGRIGCLINGCCFGKPTGSWFHVTYIAPPHNLVHDIQVENGVIDAHEACLPVFPVQLVQSLINLSIVIVLLVVARRLKRPGQLFGLFLVLYAVGRFVNEFNRGDYISYYFGVFTIAQVICLLLLPVGVGIMVYRRPRADTSGAGA